MWIDENGLIWDVSKLFRAYGLYNVYMINPKPEEISFQSSFELTGYITMLYGRCMNTKPQWAICNRI